MVITTQPITASAEVLLSRIAGLETALQSERDASQIIINQLRLDFELLRKSHERLTEELALIRHRIFLAKAERIDTAQLELEFAEKLAHLDQLKKQNPPADPDPAGKLDADSNGDDKKKDGKKKAKPHGRRDLRELNLPETRIEISDPAFEELVSAGKAVRVGSEDSCKLAWQRGGQIRLLIARVTYRTEGADGETLFATAALPPEAFARSLAAPSMLAHIIDKKFCVGAPLFRIEDKFRRDGAPVDRGTMSRWLEDAGATAGATVIEAARKEALATAFCLSTDASGIAVQPDPKPDKSRQACRRGHYFVQIADRDHVFFEYTPRETSAAVGEMFRGFTGYVQSDAKNVFDILFRPPPLPPDPDDPHDGCVRKQVGCWTHNRRGFWEVAVTTKHPVAREAVYRIGRIYELEESWKNKTPEEIGQFRKLYMRPHMDSFFAWASVEFEKVKEVRSRLRSALGYAVRQEMPLRRVIEDGRLRLDNNHSEQAFKPLAVGRKAWLFVGSDLHAASTGHLLSLIASARMHNLDSEAYLRDFFRVLPHWPHDRYLELAPKYWAATRARLVPAQLAAEYGRLDVPPASAKQQPSG